MSIHVTDRCRRYPKFRLHAVTPPSARRGADTVLRYREEGRHRRDTAQRCQRMVRHRSAVSGDGRDTAQRCQRVARHRSAVSGEWSDTAQRCRGWVATPLSGVGGWPDTAQRCRMSGPTPLSGVGGGVRHRSAVSGEGSDTDRRHGWCRTCALRSMIVLVFGVHRCVESRMMTVCA